MSRKRTESEDLDRKVVATTIEELPVNLTDDEKLSRGLELARERAEVEKAEERKASLVATCKSEIELHVGKASLLARALNQGWEYRPVDVDEVHIFPENRVVAVRKDTGETIRERSMTAQERQRVLPLATE